MQFPASVEIRSRELKPLSSDDGVTMSREQTITILTTSDLSLVGGSTEPYYLIREISQSNDVHVFTTGGVDNEDVTEHRLPNSGPVPALIWYNIFIFPLLLYHCFVHRPNVLYTYKGFNIAPWLLQQGFETRWIADFRTEPIGQDTEWTSVVRGDSGIRSLYYYLYKSCYRRTLPSCEHVISLNESVAETLRGEYNVADDRIVIVELGVDTSRFDPARFERRSGKSFKCVYVGALARPRELELCIDAVAIIRNRGVDVELHFVGDGPSEYVAELRAHAKSCSISEKVVWHGYVNHDEIPEVLSRMDVGLSQLPAHRMFEVSSPAKVYEYLSMGLPVVCSDIRAHRAVLGADDPGFFYDPGNAEAMADQLLRLIETDDEELQSYRTRARELALENDWSERIATIERLL